MSAGERTVGNTEACLMASYLRDTVKLSFKPNADHVDRIYDCALALEQREALLSEREALRDALGNLIRDTQEWCDAVNEDSSWDGWDRHYKSLAYGGLDEYRAALALISKAEGGAK